MTLTLFVIWCSLAMSLTAALVCAYASRHSFPELRPVFAASGVLALIYSGAYLWLGFNIERSAQWSQYVRPVGLIAWPVAWIFPPAMSVLLYMRVRRTLGGES